jgi:hypothetical protein
VSWTLVIAIYGAVTGTAGAVAAIRSLRDSTWGRRARALDARTDLTQLREAIAEAKARPERARSLTATAYFRGHLQAMDEARNSCPDRQLRRLLGEVNTSCRHVLSVVPEDPQESTYASVHAIDLALDALSQALARLDLIERKAPSLS